MKIKKLIFYIFVVVSIFVIYKVTFKDTKNYVALGDSLALGVNPYGEISYGYTDYIKDYLKKLEKLESYTNGFAEKNQTIEDLYEDITNNKTIVKNGNRYNIKSSLRESDLVTISIGLTDFKQDFTLDSFIDKLNDKESIKKRIDDIMIEFDDLLKLVKKYAKKDIIVVGYYNLFPYLDSYKKEINEFVEYSNKKYQQICGKNNAYFVNISNYFSDRTDYLPNPFNTEPSILGYNEIFKQVRKTLDNKILNN